MEEDTIFTLGVDASEAEAGFTSFEEGVGGIADAADAAASAIDEAAATIDEALASIGESADAAAPSLDAVTASADAAAASADGVAASADAAAASLDTAAAGAEAASGGMDLAGVSAAQLSTAMDALNISTGQVTMVGLAALVAGGLFVKMGTDGEDALTRVQALTGASQAQMEQYTTAIDGMASKYGKSVSDLAGGLYDIASVGLTGSDAINTLDVATQAAAAGGTDLHTVTSGLTGIMKAFGVSGKDASSVMDTLLLGVRDGKASFEDYSNAIGLVAVSAKGAGFSLNESAAALSTLTAVFPNARRAGMDLQHLMTQVGVNSAKVGDDAKKMGLNFDQATFNSDNLQQKLLYLQQITGGNQAEMLKLTGGTAGFAAAQVLLANKSADFSRNLADMKNKTGATKNAFDIWSHSVGAHAATITGGLSAVSQQFVVMAGPAITGGLDAVAHAVSGLSGVLSFMATHTEQVKVAAIIMGGVLLGVIAALIPMFYAWAVAAWAAITPILIAAAPFILIGLAVGVVIAAIYELVTHWKQVSAFLEGVWHAVVSGVVAGFHWLSGEAQLLWSEIVARFNAGVAFVKGLVDAGFKLIRFIIFAQIEAIVGVFSWLYNHNYYFKDLVDGIVKLFTEAKAFITRVWSDIVGWVVGTWTKLRLEAQIAWAFVSAIVEREVTRVKTRLEAIWDDITGRITRTNDRIKSMIIGLWTDVTSFIGGIASRIGAAVDKGFIQPILKPLTSLISGAVQWGENLMKNFIQGIQNLAGQVGQAAQGVAKNIASFLGFHSPTEEGPGATADQWMPALGELLAGGLRDQVGKVKAQAANIAASIAGAIHGGMAGLTTPGAAFTSPALSTPSIATPSVATPALSGPVSSGVGGGLGALGGLGGSAAPVLAAILAELRGQGSRIPALGAAPSPASVGSVTQNLGGVNISGVTDINSLYQQLDKLAGLAIENGARGATAGLGM